MIVEKISEKKVAFMPTEGIEMSVTVSKEDIVKAFREAGVNEKDTILIHSSLKSFGYVEGGAMSVIDAAKEAVTEEGTVVFPTLVQRDFANAYKNWDKDKSPSDVGYITEVFRKLPGSYRSDQATHSVAAWGKNALELVSEHTAYGPRQGVFRDYCFSYSSPWQKMYFLGTRIVFIGVNTVYNTFKHFAEYKLVEFYLNSIPCEKRKCMAMSKIARHNIPGVWPFHDANKTEKALDEAGLISYAKCGRSLFTSIRADEYTDFVLKLFKENPDEWFNENFIRWLDEYVRV
jgi:aminoglycoside 3-N-acetyltransferase